MMKVYHWFDDYENLDVNKTLSPSRVKALVNQGKVAKSHSITELEILWEDLVNGPYFGENRDLEKRLGDSSPAPRGRSPDLRYESDAIGQDCSSGEQLAIIGTTIYVRGGGFQPEAFIKRIQPSYDRVGLDSQDHTHTCRHGRVSASS